MRRLTDYDQVVFPGDDDRENRQQKHFGISAGYVFDLERAPAQGYYTLPVSGVYTTDLQTDNFFDQPNSTGTYHVTLERAPFKPSAAGVHAVVAPTENLTLAFDKVETAGDIYATVLLQNQIEPLPANFALTADSLLYNLSTSAIVSGNISVTINVPNVADETICGKLRILHYVGDRWDFAANAAPLYNADTRVCTVSQTVSSLSPFVVAQFLAPTAAPVQIGGRVTTATARGIRNVVVTMTDSEGRRRTAQTTAFGYYRFDNVAAGETVTLTARAKQFVFSQSTIVRTVNESISDADFTGAQ